MTIIHTPLLVASLVIFVGACTPKVESPHVSISGGKSGIVTTETIISSTSQENQKVRGAALLGVYVTEYVSSASSTIAAQGALTGIAVDEQILSVQNTIKDPDYSLLQAFADALQVDVADLLNRSVDRQEALDTYTTALTNVATKANERFKELTFSLDEVKKKLQLEGRERSAAERELKTALSKKDFSQAGEQQKLVLQKQQAYAETDLERQQLTGIIATLNRLLALYGEKILAIQKNREILIAGNRLVDVPGVEELQIILRDRKSSPKAKDIDLLLRQNSL